MFQAHQIAPAALQAHFLPSNLRIAQVFAWSVLQVNTVCSRVQRAQQVAAFVDPALTLNRARPLAQAVQQAHFLSRNLQAVLMYVLAAWQASMLLSMAEQVCLCVVIAVLVHTLMRRDPVFATFALEESFRR